LTCTITRSRQSETRSTNSQSYRVCIEHSASTAFSTRNPHRVSPCVWHSKFITDRSLLTCATLSTLDLSFNLLKAVPDTLEKLTSLKTIYFVQNRITKISGLSGVGSTLRSLELGGNRIRVIEELDALINLEELWLGKNKITKLENLGHLKHLRILALQSNRITKIEGLESLENLEELYLSHNGVQRLEGLEHNTKLSTLDIGNNLVPKIENVAHLTELTEFWMNNNKVETLADIETELGALPALETVYLEGNPVQRIEGVHYRRKIQMALPKLKQIDATATR